MTSLIRGYNCSHQFIRPFIGVITLFLPSRGYITSPKFLTWLAGKSTMNQDVFPIESGDFPASHVSFRECTYIDTVENRRNVRKFYQ